MGPEDSRAAQGPSRIIVADDHPLLRSAIRHTLEGHSDLEVVGEAANGRQALELCRRLRPDLVLMDLRMPEMDGIEATRAIKKEFPETLVLILTALEEPTDLSESLKVGAAGYVLKDASAAQISDAVRRVLAGEISLDQQLATRLLMGLMDRGTQQETSKQEEEDCAHTSASSQGSLRERRNKRIAVSLTPREVEVLRLVVRGQTNQQIARNLSISVSTVKRHVRHISAKLGVCDRVQLAVRAVELGLLDERSRG